MAPVQRRISCLSITLSVVICFGLLIGSTPGYAAPTPASELLYVQDGHNLITYKIASGSIVKLATLYINASPSFPIQIFHSPTAPYLYILGFTSATEEYFWVHATTSQGVPTENPIQKLEVKPALSQFFFHPNGKFGYALYSWTAPADCESGTGFVADIVLYTVSPATGKLVNTHRPVANFPTNCSQTTVYGLNPSGTKLYTDAYNEEGLNNQNSYSSYGVTGTTGLLSSGTPFFSFDSGSQALAVFAIDNPLIVMWNNGEDSLPPGIYVYPNVVNPTTPTFYCGTIMLSVCGDFPSYPASVLFDPSGGYLFLNDQSISSTVIAAIDLIHDTLTETGSSIAGNPSIISFSPDATTVYAVEGKNVLAYGFNSSSGSLTSEGSVSLPLNVGAIVAASRP
jgi:hypothetical protein